MQAKKPLYRAAAAGVACAALALATACSSGGTTDQDADTFTWWDPYPQHACSI